MTVGELRAITARLPATAEVVVKVKSGYREAKANIERKDPEQSSTRVLVIR